MSDRQPPLKPWSMRFDDRMLEVFTALDELRKRGLGGA